MDVVNAKELRRLRRRHGDWLLTLLTVLLLLMIFVLVPLQASGVAISQAFALVLLLAIIAGVLVISTRPVPLLVMSIAFATNLFVIVFRLYWPTTYDLQIVAGSWLVIAMTLGVVVTQG